MHGYMKRTINNRKGQTALEAMMLILLVIASVGVIAGSIVANTGEIKDAYYVRLGVQEAVTSLSLKRHYPGSTPDQIQTTLIRIDELPTGNYRVWIASDNCDIAKGRIRGWSNLQAAGRRIEPDPAGILCTPSYTKDRP